MVLFMVTTANDANTTVFIVVIIVLFKRVA